MTLAYRALFRLYPKDHRTCFGAEMQSVFEEVAQDHRSRGWAAYLRFALAEYAGLVIGAGTAWAVTLAGRGYVYNQRLIRPANAAALPGEVQEAQDRLTANLTGLLHAISHRQYLKARRYAAEEQKARAELRLLRDKYNIAESGDCV
jgi:hypothetical protein